jgi:acyl-CoA synthetase (AMP-forming)/AMP-acid ligase II
VADTCVVGIPDSYSGEVPLAFVVPSEEALAMIERDVNVVSNIKASIMNVRLCPMVAS